MFKHKNLIYLLLSLIILLSVSLSWAQQEETSKIFCSKCGIENTLENKFCYNCGNKLIKKEVAPKTSTFPPKQPLAKPKIDKTLKTKTVQEIRRNNELKAKRLFENGVALLKIKAYLEARNYFNKIIHEYPDTKYYELALVMRDVCSELQIISSSSNRSGGMGPFALGFLGGCSALAGLFLISMIIIGSL
jgi:hypothetical protein